VARISGTIAAYAGPSAKLTYWFTRRHFARPTGRAPERGIEPLQICAHLPRLLRAYGRFEQAVAKLHGLDRRADALAELKAATLIHRGSCLDLTAQICRQPGLGDQELLALPAYRTSGLFSDAGKPVLGYAVAMTRTPAEEIT
jgi:alkylhydroperoxidase family enzyme